MTVQVKRLGSLNYRLFVPGLEPGAKVPLVVALHGCMQDAESFAHIVRLDSKAVSEGFIVVYPEQSRFRNLQACWNWFHQKNQVRGGGEPEKIVTLIRHLVSEQPVDPARVYVLGISAGATMANTLGTCYPDVFAAVGIHSGLEFRAATGAWEGAQVMLKGNRKDPRDSGSEAAKCILEHSKHRKRLAAIVFQGTSDRVVHPTHARQVVEQIMETNHILQGRTEPRVPGDWLISENASQVPGGHSYRVADFGLDRSCPLVRLVEVEGMGHAWSGGPGKIAFSDPRGPDASGMMWDFLKGFRLEET